MKEEAKEFLKASGILLDAWWDFKIKYVLPPLLIFMVVCFIWQFFTPPETTTKLGSGYIYYRGGGDYNYIYHENYPRERKIPRNIISCNYKRSGSFIVAKQKPDEYDKSWEKEVIYPLGRDTVYYWLIIKEDHKILGPLDSIQFCKEIKKYHVPDKLVRKMKPTGKK